MPAPTQSASTHLSSSLSNLTINNKNANNNQSESKTNEPLSSKQFLNTTSKLDTSTSSNTKDSSLDTSSSPETRSDSSEFATNRETIIVFDWDDTLLCSTFLSSRGLRLDSPHSKIIESGLIPVLKELEESITKILTIALSFGTVHIITNAETGWIQLSAQKFIPGVCHILKKIPLLSARSTYEGRHPDSPLKWKFYAFQDTLTPYLINRSQYKWKNVLSFGDSHVEREAVRAVSRGFQQTRCKSVKYAERPSLEQLKRQIELVTNCFAYIYNHDGDLDLQLTVTISQNDSQMNNNTSQAVRDAQTKKQQEDAKQIIQNQNNVGSGSGIKKKQLTSSTKYNKVQPMQQSNPQEQEEEKPESL